MKLDASPEGLFTELPRSRSVLGNSSRRQHAPPCALSPQPPSPAHPRALRVPTVGCGAGWGYRGCHYPTARRPLLGDQRQFGRHLLNYGRARVPMAHDAEARKEHIWRIAHTRGLERSSTFRNYTQSEPRFRALLTEGGVQRIGLARASGKL